MKGSHSVPLPNSRDHYNFRRRYKDYTRRRRRLLARPRIGVDASDGEEDKNERAREWSNIDDGEKDEPAARVS